MIKEFKGQYAFLSNFYACTIDYEGITYPTVEHAYQAAKTLDPKLRKKIAEIKSPAFAKKEGRQLPLRDDWDKIKVKVMFKLLCLKFKQKKFKELLLATKDEELIEGNYWRDTFWGVHNGKGHNYLGRLLMRIRRQLTEQFTERLANSQAERHWEVVSEDGKPI